MSENVTVTIVVGGWFALCWYFVGDVIKEHIRSVARRDDDEKLGRG